MSSSVSARFREGEVERERERFQPSRTQPLLLGTKPSPASRPWKLAEEDE